MINLLCSSKPGDGLLRYSYEHCAYLNSIGIKSQLIIIPHYNFSKQDYLTAISEQYKTPHEPIIFDVYNPHSNEITLVMGRSMVTLPYKDRKMYSHDQLITLHQLFSNNLISVYSENHPTEYPLALEYFNAKKVYDLCDTDVYPAGVGGYFQKMINFSVYKPVVQDTKFEFLFLGTNREYYGECVNVLLNNKHFKKQRNHKSYGIITYNEKWINPNLNNIFVPVKNLLGIFNTYVYTKPSFDPAPRLIQECKWLGKEVIYTEKREKMIKDGGAIYWNRPVPTAKMYSDNINILVNMIKAINNDNRMD
tara:strand:- start:498 stop:1418 length:921 start_codon:yes stop_codon:yes gene_type:complete